MSIPACYYKSDALDFLSQLLPGWVVMYLDSRRTVFTFRSWLDVLGVVLAFWISILQIFKSLLNVWHRVTLQALKSMR